MLWTAGWDSTFRVADLLVNGTAVVQPWYAVDPYRRSTATELATQDVIRAHLAELDPAAARRLLPVTLVEVGAIPPGAGDHRRVPAAAREAVPR